jgi:ketosteroid isomerase-like protein
MRTSSSPAMNEMGRANRAPGAIYEARLGRVPRGHRAVAGIYREAVLISNQNVELVQASWEAWERGDMEAVFAFYDPAIEVFDHDLPDATESYRGLDGLRRWQADWEASWDSWRWEPEEFIDAGDRVVAVLRAYARGRGSGVDVERLDGAVYTLHDGKCVRLDYYGSKAEALKAVGQEA